MTRALHSVDAKKPATTAAERELKFLADAKAFDAAPELPLLGGPEAGSEKRLESIYFDTEDGDLERERIALRVRQVDGGCVQGVKWDMASDAGAFEREEREVESPSGEPDLALFGAATARALARIVGGKSVGARFGSDIRRMTRTITFKEARLEIAFDSGFLFAGERREPVREIEVEQKSGPPAALFVFGLALIEALPVRISVESKAARASRLRTDEPPTPVKSQGLSLTPEISLDEAIAALLHNCLAHFLDNLPALASGDRVEAVHQMRVAMRRLRSALGLIGRAFPCEAFEDLRASSKRIGALLGEARDRDVFLETLRNGPLPRFAAEPGFAGLLRAAEARADAARDDVLSFAGGKAATRFALVVERVAAERGWRGGLGDDALRRLDKPVVGFAAECLDRLDRKVRKRGRHFEKLTPEARHALRIALKHMRYATEFFGTLFHPASAAEDYAEKAAALQDRLGALNDAAIAVRLVSGLDRSPDIAYAAGVAAGWCARASVGDERELAKAWRSLRKTERFWRSGRAAGDPEKD
jgi:triphosphatase